MKKSIALKDAVTYYLFLRLAQWYMKEYKENQEKTLDSFNTYNNFNRTKSQCILFLMCTASRTRKKFFDLYTWKASNEEPWMIEGAFPMECDTPLILADQYSIEWHLFSIKLKDGGLLTEPTSVVMMMISSLLREIDVVEEFNKFAIEIERTIEKLSATRDCPDFVLWDPEVYVHRVKSQNSWAVYSQLPSTVGKVIPQHMLVHEKSTLGEGKTFSFS